MPQRPDAIDRLIKHYQEGVPVFVIRPVVTYIEALEAERDALLAAAKDHQRMPTAPLRVVGRRLVPGETVVGDTDRRIQAGL